MALVCLEGERAVEVLVFGDVLMYGVGSTFIGGDDVSRALSGGSVNGCQDGLRTCLIEGMAFAED
jgi:hypothetical protein